jgi:hypothetical protein
VNIAIGNEREFESWNRAFGENPRHRTPNGSETDKRNPETFTQGSLVAI